MKHFLLFPLVLLLSLPAIAAEVTDVKKKRSVVTINEGSDQGISKGQKICFTNPNGKKVACGKAVKVKPDSTVVKVKKKRIGKIQVGYLTEGSSGGGGGSSSSGKSFAIRGLYLGGMTPFTYNKVEYLAPGEGTPSSLWNPGQAQNTALIAFGMEFDMTSLGVAAGFKYLQLSPFETEEDYTTQAADPYIVNLNSGSSFGFYVDYYFIKTNSVGNGLRVGAGLDINMSTINLTITQKSASAGDLDIYNNKSELTTISLRAPVSYDINLDGIGINAGVNILIPIMGDPKTTYETQDNNIDKYGQEDNLVYGQEDFIAGLGHKKSSFGLEIVLGAYYAF